MPKLTVPQLRKRCKEAGLVTTGNKQELIDRLEAHEFHTVSNTLNVELMQRVSQLEKTLEDLKVRAEVTDGTLDDFSPPLRSSPQKQVRQNYDLANAADSPTGYTASIANGAPLTVYASSPAAATTCGAPAISYASSAVASTTYGAPLTACAPSAAPSTAYVATSTTHGMRVAAPITYGATTSRCGPGVTAPSEYGATTTASDINPPVSMTPQYYASEPNAGVHFANIPTESEWVTHAAPPRSGVYLQNTVPPSKNFVAQHALPMAPGYIPDLQAMNGPPANPVFVGSSYGHVPMSTLGLKDMVAILPEFDPMNNASLSSTIE